MSSNLPVLIDNNDDLENSAINWKDKDVVRRITPQDIGNIRENVAAAAKTKTTTTRFNQGHDNTASNNRLLKTQVTISNDNQTNTDEYVGLSNNISSQLPSAINEKQADVSNTRSSSTYESVDKNLASNKMMTLTTTNGKRRVKRKQQPQLDEDITVNDKMISSINIKHQKMPRNLRRSSTSTSALSSSSSSSSISLSSATQGRLKQFIICSLFIFGLIICVMSIICILLLPSIVTNLISRRLVLKNNSLLLDRWSKPSVPMYFKVWMFNVKNARELIDMKGSKPELEEIGPFVFNLRRQKDVISFAGDNLYYTERKVYHFNRELSCCSINTTVTIPNIPLVAVVDRALGYNIPLLGRFVPRLINRAIQSLREQLFVKKQVGEILFDGYDAELLKMVSRIGSIVGLPQQNQRFALFKGRNNTWRPEQDGVFAINTGARDRRLFGKVSSWNSYKQLPFWSSSQCNVINGSDGTLFPPPISNREPLYIFNQELCRTVNLVYQQPSEIHSIKAYRFALNPLNFAHTMQPSSPSAPMSNHNNNAPLIAPTTITSNKQQQQQQQNTVIIKQQQTNQPILDSNTPISRLSRQLAAPFAPAVVNANDQMSQNVNSNKQLIEKQEKFVQNFQNTNEKWTSETNRNPQSCFCDRKSTKLGQRNVCEFDGLIDLSKCSKQAQVVFGSMPHFHNSDLRLLRQVDGLSPNASRHTTYLDIEPNTGLVLGGKRRVQLNLLIKHNNEVDGFQNINDMLVPLVWFEESAQITDELAKKFKSSYTDKVRLVNLVLFGLLLASVVLLLVDARLMATRYFGEFRLLNSNSNIIFNDAEYDANGTSKAVTTNYFPSNTVDKGAKSPRLNDANDYKTYKKKKRTSNGIVASGVLPVIIGSEAQFEHMANSRLIISGDDLSSSNESGNSETVMTTTR